MQYIREENIMSLSYIYILCNKFFNQYLHLKFNDYICQCCSIDSRFKVIKHLLLKTLFKNVALLQWVEKK